MTMNLSLTVAAVVLGSAFACAADIDRRLVDCELAKGEKVAVWPAAADVGKAPYAIKNTDDGNVRLTDVLRPELALFRPKAKSPGPVPAVIVCPGGAYLHLSYKTEGTDIAEWLQGQGIAAFVLKYSCPNCPDKAFSDAQRAISLVRSRAGEWNVDPARIGIMGFSAGGNLAARVSTNWRHRSYPEVDGADAVSCRPDFTVLVYPAWLVPGSRTESTLPVVLCGEFPVDAQTPPAFLMQAQDDPAHVENVLAYYVALKYAGVAADLHVFDAGGHGFGLRKLGTAVDGWEDLAAKWLVRTAFADKSK